MNVKEELKKIKDYFSPKVIGEINDVYVKIAKIKGDKLPWHSHNYEDEFFYVIDGTLLMEIEGQKIVEMKQGDFYVVKKGISHKVSSEEECNILLIENKSTAHTGNIKTEITKSIEDQLK
ncbi:MAG: cupin domain-containing protein [Marinilabiliales bacterium]|nr:MAG: cupin domain-containing protein [Marinilabiliales bacterium]